MSDEEQGFDDVPIITYSNRIQKHMFKLTDLLALDNIVSMTEKRMLRLLIANLPPEAKEKESIQKIYKRCESKEECLSTLEFDKMYGEVSDWIYKNILQDAFKAKPVYRKKMKL